MPPHYSSFHNSLVLLLESADIRWITLKSMSVVLEYPRQMTISILLFCAMIEYAEDRFNSEEKESKNLLLRAKVHKYVGGRIYKQYVNHEYNYTVRK